MSIVFDQDKNFTYIYRYIDGVYETTNLATSTAFDLFPDDADVDDYIIFGNRNPGWSYHDLTFNIGTALMAANITVVWEKFTYTNTWTAIPSVTDNTNAFRNTGVNTVEFDIPENMQATGSRWDHRINIGGNKYGNWIRCRITAVTGITEGGATQTDKVTCKDATITVTDEANLTLEDLQTECDTNSWEIRSGVKAVETLGNFTMIRGHLLLTGATGFKETQKSIQMGEDNYRQGFRSFSTLPFELGERDASGKGKNGCMLDMRALFDGAYDYVYNFQAYGSIIFRTSTQYGAFSMYKVFKFVDSVFISSSRWYIASGVLAGSEWARSVYADNDLLYLYSQNLAIDTFKTLDAWQGMLCGGSATISNTDINGKSLKRYYSSQMTLIDCINIDKSKITNHSPSNGADRHVRIKYNINYHIIDKDNNPVQGASVILKDKNGNETFNVTTGADGKITEQLVMAYDKWWEYADSWALHEDDYNDFSLEIKNGGKSYVMDKFTIDAPVDDQLQLQSGGSINKSFSKRLKIC